MGKVRRVQGIIWFACSVVSVIILFRFSLQLLGANPNAGFADLVYSISYPLVAPFLVLFGTEAVYGNSILEFSSLVAVCAYLVLAAGLCKLASLTMSPNDPTGQAYE